jgi:hypothetical protein
MILTHPGAFGRVFARIGANEFAIVVCDTQLDGFLGAIASICGPKPPLDFVFLPFCEIEAGTEVDAPAVQESYLASLRMSQSQAV